MNEARVRIWVEGVISLAASGGSHEIERDPELNALEALIEDEEVTPQGVVLSTTDGSRWLVSVTRL
jgi:hypothetical protein